MANDVRTTTHNRLFLTIKYFQANLYGKKLKVKNQLQKSDSFVQPDVLLNVLFLSIKNYACLDMCVVQHILP
jgi:hypothetical protein